MTDWRYENIEEFETEDFRTIVHILQVYYQNNEHLRSSPQMFPDLDRVQKLKRTFSRWYGKRDGWEENE